MPSQPWQLYQGKLTSNILTHNPLNTKHNFSSPTYAVSGDLFNVGGSGDASICGNHSQFIGGASLQVGDVLPRRQHLVRRPQPLSGIWKKRAQAHDCCCKARQHGGCNRVSDSLKLRSLCGTGVAWCISFYHLFASLAILDWSVEGKKASNWLLRYYIFRPRRPTIE